MDHVSVYNRRRSCCGRSTQPCNRKTNLDGNQDSFPRRNGAELRTSLRQPRSCSRRAAHCALRRCSRRAGRIGHFVSALAAGRITHFVAALAARVALRTSSRRDGSIIAPNEVRAANEIRGKRPRRICPPRRGGTSRYHALIVIHAIAHARTMAFPRPDGV
jgi:hypothetical protein